MAALTRFVFITGGVVSSLGKGLGSAALGALLQARGYKVRLRKLDPYLNVDPGTSPCGLPNETLIVASASKFTVDNACKGLVVDSDILTVLYTVKVLPGAPDPSSVVAVISPFGVPTVSAVIIKSFAGLLPPKSLPLIKILFPILY